MRLCLTTPEIEHLDPEKASRFETKPQASKKASCAFRSFAVDGFGFDSFTVYSYLLAFDSTKSHTRLKLATCKQ